MAGTGNGGSGSTRTRSRSEGLTADQVAELRRWALRVGSNGAEGTLRAATKAVVKLANESNRLRTPDAGDDWGWSEGANGTDQASTPTPAELEMARAWASSVLGNGASRELKAAARAIILLADDVEALQTGSARPRHGERGARTATGGRNGGSLGARLSQAGAGWRKTHPLAVLAAVVPLVVLFVLFVISRAFAPSLDGQGPQNSALVGAAGMQQLAFSAESGDPSAVRWTLDGEDVTADATTANGRSTLKPAKLGRRRAHGRGAGRRPRAVERSEGDLDVHGGHDAAEDRDPRQRPPGARADAVRAGGQRRAGRDADGRREARRADGRCVHDAIPVAARPASGAPGRGLGREHYGRDRLVHARPTKARRADARRARHGGRLGERRAPRRCAPAVEEGKINTVELDLKDELGVIGWNAPVAVREGRSAPYAISTTSAGR